MKIAVGCGWRRYGDGWTHIDGGDYPNLDGTDIYLRDFEDNSAEVIYASHVIAYFDRNEIVDLLKEWNRVLKPDGILRIATPNFWRITKMYEFSDIKLSKVLGPLYGKMKMGENTIYHKTTYDFSSLRKVLVDAGFREVEYYNHKKTEHANVDDHSAAYLEGELISLNVEARK